MAEERGIELIEIRDRPRTTSEMSAFGW